MLLKWAYASLKEKETNEWPDKIISISFHGPSVSTAGYTEGQLFTFDPDTLPAKGWQRLGLNNRAIKKLLNYRNKGSRFYKKKT